MSANQNTYEHTTTDATESFCARMANGIVAATMDERTGCLRVVARIAHVLCLSLPASAHANPRT
eukprot:5852396-Lingulodinium_polyedra.AAC.1